MRVSGRKGAVMPIYEYQCEACGNSFEKLVFKRDDDHVLCFQCGDKKVKRLVSSPSFIGTAGEGGCAGDTPTGFS